MRVLLPLSALAIVFVGAYVLQPAARIAASCFAAADRTACYERVIPALYPRFTRDELFDALRLLQRVDPAAAACHQIAHGIADAVVRQEPARWADELVAAEGHRLCSFGYAHGAAIAAMRYVSADMGAQTTRELPHRCDMLGGRARSNCFHGLGHLFYYAYDMRQALAACDSSTNETRLRARCHAGVVMGVFFVTPDDPAPERQRVTMSDAPAFCAALGNEYETECRRTSWIIAPAMLRSRSAIESFCAGIPDEPRACFSRVFRGLAWLEPADRERHESLCAEFDDPLHDVCIASGALEHALAVGSDRPARERCDVAHDERACVDAIAGW